MSSADSVASDVAHLLRRAGFGPSPSVLDAAVSAGYEATAASLLDFGGDDPADAVSPPQMSWYPSDLLGGNPSQNATLAAERNQFEATQRALLPDLVGWWLRRMQTSAHPLREKLTFHLHNNFATAISKVRLPLLMYNQNQLLRAQGNGSFEDLTQAIAKDPAMMIWLDTDTDKALHPNENFARELMERFTMGVGNYTQNDVEEAARGFTGWTLDMSSGQYAFNPKQFDGGVKTYLGQTGAFTGEDIVHIATNSDASHRWVTSRLWSLLAYPVATTDPLVVNDLVPVYVQSLDVGDLLAAIFHHPQFTSTQAKTGLVKQPVEYVVGAAIALGVPITGVTGTGSSGTGGGSSSVTGHASVSARVVSFLNQLGQVPFDPPNVGGWPQNQYWLSTASSLARWQFAETLVRTGDISTVESASPSDRPDAVAALLGLTDGWSNATSTALKDAAGDPVQVTALALVSPEYVSN